MRQDMTRVLVARPRRGYCHKPSRSGDRLLTRQCQDEDGRETFLAPLDGPRSRRESRLHRNPLERYLSKQVGRPWDEVYSEIAAQAPSTTRLGDRLREEVSYIVEDDIALVDGALVGRWGYPPSDLYVDPVTGLLSRPERAPRPRHQPRKDYEMVDVDARHKYVLIGEHWYLVTLRDLPVCNPDQSYRLAHKERYDVVLQQFAFGHESGSAQGSVFRRLWGSDVFATSKQQASKKELRWISLQRADRTAGGDSVLRSGRSEVSYRPGYQSRH